MKSFPCCRLFPLLLLLLLHPLLAMAQGEGFPGRSIYPKVKVVETEQLARDFDRYTIVDVRSNYEYDTLHIDGAINLPLNKPGFIRGLRQLMENGKPVVFYCNGHSCYKSYKATRKAQQAGITRVAAYDAGVFDWARAYPEQAVLLGQKPVNPEHLIGKEQLKRHLLSPADFARRAQEAVEILDVRDGAQRGLIEIFPFRQTNIPLDDSERLERFLRQVKESGKTLLVYDAAGKQVRWLQYRLEQAGITDYWFMEGGMKNWFKRGG